MPKRRIRVELLLPLLFLVASTACAPSPSASLDVAASYADRPQLQGRAMVQLKVKTSSGVGKVTLELRGDAAPLTAGNFADLVQRGFYNGIAFDRVVKDPEPFLVQSGDAAAKRQIPLEIPLQGEDRPRYNTLLDPAVKPLLLRHERGAVAMARSSALDSGSSQFYIALSTLPTLDGRFAVFGYVIEGMEWIDKVQQGDTIVSAQIIGGQEHLSRGSAP